MCVNDVRDAVGLSSGDNRKEHHLLLRRPAYERGRAPDLSLQVLLKVYETNVLWLVCNLEPCFQNSTHRQQFKGVTRVLLMSSLVLFTSCEWRVEDIQPRDKQAFVLGNKRDFVGHPSSVIAAGHVYSVNKCDRAFRRFPAQS